MMRPARFGACLSLALAASACAEGGKPEEQIPAWDEDEYESGWTAPEEPDDGGVGASTGGGSGGASSSSHGDAGASGACGAGKHFCGGLCAGNTPETGCSDSSSCKPCTSPDNGAATCSHEGTCDFECDDGYIRVEGHCACASQCCTSFDCEGGDVCNQGMCVPPPCYPLECIGACFFQLQCGGICLGTTCHCFPCQ